MNLFIKLFKLRFRIKQRPTPMSLFVVILLFGFFLEAYMHNFNLVYIALFFVFAIAFSVTPFGMLNLGELKVEYDHSERLFASLSGFLIFRIENLSFTPSWAIELRCDNSMTKIAKVEGESKKLVNLEIIPQKRGKILLEKCHLESLYPISTVRFVLPIDKNIETIVYPTPKGISLKSFLAKQESHFGEERDFDGLSTYSGNESISRIHWASVAKGTMAVKKFSHQKESKELLFNFYQSGDNDEERLSQLTLWVLECEKSGESFRIQLPNKEIQSKKESINAILETLALY